MYRLRKNDLEKLCQVSNMGGIYTRDEEVLVWMVYEPDQDESDRDARTHDAADILSMSRTQLETTVLENSY
jgi:hypothetical protein